MTITNYVIYTLSRNTLFFLIFIVIVNFWTREKKSLYKCLFNSTVEIEIFFLNFGCQCSSNPLSCTLDGFVIEKWGFWLLNSQNMPVYAKVDFVESTQEDYYHNQEIDFVLMLTVCGVMTIRIAKFRLFYVV